MPGITYDFEPPVAKAALLEFRNPSGTTVRARIAAFELINRGRPMNHAVFSLERTVKKGEIEQGAKMFLVNSDDQ